MTAPQKAWELLRNNGVPYALYRSWHKLKEQSGWLRIQFPAGKLVTHNLNLQQWKTDHSALQIGNKSSCQVQPHYAEQIASDTQRILAGEAQWFHGNWYTFTGADRWVKNPVSGYIYSNTTHWSTISSYVPGEDIKYVWDPARFEFIFPVLHHDALHKEDHAAFVLDTILSFIDHARVQEGPHYVSCQEMAIRVMHWCFILHFYRDSPALTDSVFQKICTSILTQTAHIEKHIAYARYLVRNNHVLSEAAALYTVGTYFPAYPDSKKWRARGWQIFADEILFQFEEDGSYLQHAHNYHRMANRLITWMICMGKYNQQEFTTAVKSRIEKSLQFLVAAVIDTNGSVPLYGNNDGSNIFPFAPAPYSDYRPSLNSLSVAVSDTHIYPGFNDDAGWFGLHSTQFTQAQTKMGIESFTKGGYYWLRDVHAITAIRCHAYKRRPAHADNLHVDITVQGINILRDSGVFQYNTSAAILKYFQGTAGHNTITIGDMDQMLKGGRFIWYYWTKGGDVQLHEDAQSMRFTGTIRAFRQSGRWITHSRQVEYIKQVRKWIITDTIEGNRGLPVHQHWHPHPRFAAFAEISAIDANGNALTPRTQGGYHAALYGVLTETQDIIFTTGTNVIVTTISLINEQG